MAKVAVKSLGGEDAGRVDLDPKWLEGRVDATVLYHAVNGYRANRRAGTASAKSRGVVSGGGSKPWRQKGTGRARAGSNRSPLWRHGGAIFGPRPRSYRQRLSVGMRRRALLAALRGKWRDQELMVVDEPRVDEPRTKAVIGRGAWLRSGGRSLVVLSGWRPAVVKSLRNVATLSVTTAERVTALDVLSHQRLLVSRDALAQLQVRCGVRDAANT